MPPSPGERHFNYVSHQAKPPPLIGRDVTTRLPPLALVMLGCQVTLKITRDISAFLGWWTCWTQMIVFCPHIAYVLFSRLSEIPLRDNPSNRDLWWITHRTATSGDSHPSLFGERMTQKALRCLLYFLVLRKLTRVILPLMTSIAPVTILTHT